MPAWTFWYWCRKLSRESPSEPSGATFVPVRVAGEPDASVVEVVLIGGERVRVGAGAPTDLVRAVLTVLRSPC